MPRPVDGAASITQSQNALELVQTAQRLAALAQARQQTSTEKAKEAAQTTVTKQEEAQGRAIKDQEPRQGRPRRKLKDTSRPSAADPAPQHIDLEA